MKLAPKIADWPPEWRELYEERSAILEYEGNMSRKWAELEAEKDTRRHAEIIQP